MFTVPLFVLIVSNALLVLLYLYAISLIVKRIVMPLIQTETRRSPFVRIVGGVFEGVEGVVIRVKGDRRVSVCIKGIMAVATAYIHPSLIELIPDTICE